MRRRIWLQATASVVLLGAAHAQLDSLPPCGVSPFLTSYPALKMLLQFFSMIVAETRRLE